MTALGLGLAGMVALVAPAARTLWDAPAGTLLMLCAAMAWAVGTVLTKAEAWTIPTAVLTGWQVLLGGVPIALGAVIRLAVLGSTGTGPRSDLTFPSSAALLGTAYATLVGAIFCHWAWFRLVAILPAAVAAIGTLGIPIVGLFTSALILGEPVGAGELVALVLVVGGLGILVGEISGRARESAPLARAVSTGREEPR
jgi:drug/metabolite transporter (DMT)-like permease